MLNEKMLSTGSSAARRGKLKEFDRENPMQTRPGGTVLRMT